MPENKNNQLNDALEFLLDEDMEREFEEAEGTWLRGRNYPEYWTDPDLTEQELLDELSEQDYFDLDNQQR